MRLFWDPLRIALVEPWGHILENAIRAELLEVEEVRGWQRDPMLYNSTLVSGLSSLSQREFAPVIRTCSMP